jgi:hypothetical protein
LQFGRIGGMRAGDRNSSARPGRFADYIAPERGDFMQSLHGRGAAFLAVCAVTLALIAPLSALAPPAAAAHDDLDPAPASIAADGVGVARVSVIDGTLAIQRGDASDSLGAVVNAPVLGGDYVVSGDASRAEIQFDTDTAIRLDQDVQMRFTHLDPHERSIQLAAGTLVLRLHRGTDGTTNIDTPSITVKPQAAGIYRVTVTPDGQTDVTVRAGDAQIVTPQAPIDLQPGNTLVAQGDAGNPSTQLQAAIAVDDFDAFNRSRDHVYALAQAQSAYIDPNIDGVADLQNAGHWVVDPTYGNVWVPTDVDASWAPYRDGRWVWEEGYGWTWIGNESWGWAPYHFGSWFNSPTYGWAWYPPQPRAVIVWRPALVAFIGFGAGAGFGLGFAGGNAFANIGWVPLAPFEPYHPWWGNRYGGLPQASLTNISNVTNVSNVTNINVYQNVRYNAVTSVSSERFIQGNFNGSAAVPAAQLRSAHVFTGAVPVVPTASNLRFSDNAARPPIDVQPALMAHTFAGNRSAIARTPFTAQRVSLATATHAVVTPLHFRDARTTPLTGATHGAWSQFDAERASHSVTAPPPRALPEERDRPEPPAPEIIDGARAVRSTGAQSPTDAAHVTPTTSSGASPRERAAGTPRPGAPAVHHAAPAGPKKEPKSSDSRDHHAEDRHPPR